MLLIDLFEDAQADVRRSAIADRYIDALVRYVYARKDMEIALPTTRVFGADRPYLEPDEFGAEGLLRDVLVIFFEDGPNINGRATRLLPGSWGSMGFAVMIRVRGETIGEISTSLLDDTVRNTLRHELQHIIDMKRRKGAVTKDVTSDADMNRSREINDDTLTAEHNKPSELNAYFHNLAEPLLFRLRLIKRTGNDHYGSFDPLPRDFRSFLAMTVDKLRGTRARHWQYVSEPNKRKIISRLMKLFDLYWEQTEAARARKVN